MRKTHTFYLWKIESWNYEQDDTRKDKFSMSHKNVAPSDAIPPSFQFYCLLHIITSLGFFYVQNV
jgi:hypothetical protein